MFRLELSVRTDLERKTPVPDIEFAQTNVESAQSSVDAAQRQVDACALNPSVPSCADAAKELDRAEAQLERSKARLDALSATFYRFVSIEPSLRFFIPTLGGLFLRVGVGADIPVTAAIGFRTLPRVSFGAGYELSITPEWRISFEANYARQFGAGGDQPEGKFVDVRVGFVYRFKGF